MLLLSVFCGGSGFGFNNRCGCGCEADYANNCDQCSSGCGGFFGRSGNSCELLIYILLLSCFCGGSGFGFHNRCGCGYEAYNDRSCGCGC
ncbi:MAG: hypothetical protein E7328_03580 [Clostridiales bacterium]|nr:hypothetical protein [Clostridiales bacterium]